MKRRPGLQEKWTEVVNSLQQIVPSYERASSRISLCQDKKVRAEAVSFAAVKGSQVLDLGSGPGTMSRLVLKAGGEPVLLDASRAMLKASGFPNAVQGVFEQLPFRDEAFECAVSGFAIRDAQDLQTTLIQVNRVLKPGGHLGIADLGKPDNSFLALAIALYLRTVPGIIGLLSTGRAGMRYSSIYDTYALVLHNSELVGFLTKFLGETSLHETQMGGSIVAKSSKRS
jgi:demethylmenaquinone methyltransferase/2-methoxy-6-polyprenyl-1,4-benzoquinol methylase